MTLRTKETRTCSKRTICEVHRQIYDLLIVDPTDPKLKELVNEAFNLGIAIAKKLVEYKCGIPKWEKNLDRIEIARIRKLRVELEKYDLDSNNLI